MTLEEKIKRVALWIIDESDETVSEVENLLDKIYRHRTTRMNEDWGVLWEDDKPTKEEIEKFPFKPTPIPSTEKM